jgi:hypothetical protein
MLQDLRNPLFRATVDLDTVYLSECDCTEVRREQYVGSFAFLFRDSVANSMIRVNPPGLTITYDRDEQAFGDVKP